MQKVIEVEEGRSFNFKASAFSPIMYNKLFPGRDFLKDMEALYFRISGIGPDAEGDGRAEEISGRVPGCLDVD